jgi:hypothetical protein
MKTEYFVWYNDGSIISKNSLEEAMELSYFEYIIKLNPIKESSKGYIQYKYDFFDKNGQKTKIKINNFELLDIIESDYNSYDKELIFYDIIRSEIFRVKKNGGFHFMFSECIINFLKKINELGSFEVYKILKKNEGLEKEIQDIRKILNEKNDLIEDLKKQIDNLNNPLNE